MFDIGWLLYVYNYVEVIRLLQKDDAKWDKELSQRK